MTAPAFSPATYRLIESISREMALNAPAGYSFLLKQQLNKGLIALTRQQGEDSSKQIQSLPGWKERMAKEFMLSRLGKKISVTEVAKACSLSRSHFSRAFKYNTGISPKEWIIYMRIEKAKELLSTTSFTLSDISLECGFSDQSHFSRTFLKQVGVSPKVWRTHQSDCLRVA